MVASSSRPTSVSRTSSTSSIDFTANAFNPTEVRRTRKRISPAQLARLEELYRQCSHPTREARDDLAKRIQMETKSVTIWFQNKRQTDRKVALHNATNSRNVAFPDAASGPPPDITLTAPTSPTRPLAAHELEEVPRRVSSDGIPRRQPSTRPVHPKRAISLASSVTSASTTSAGSAPKTRISLDRVASRSEIRLTHRHLKRSTSSSHSASLSTASSATSSACAAVSGAPTPSGNPGSVSQAPPASPPPTAPPALWETMLSSPLAPSSPPPPEYIEYARTRKARTLNWACAAARLPAPEPALPSWAGPIPSAHLPSPAFPIAVTRDSATRAREYEEATSVTEDEAELVTPHSSQDASMPWSELSAKTDTKFSNSPAVDAMDITMEGIDSVLSKPVTQCAWEEDEMHAALALCGLRG